MQLHDLKSTPMFAWPSIATAAVLLFLLRNRPITDGSSPGSGVSIAVGELVLRLSAAANAAASLVAQGFSLLLHVAAAPVIFALTAVQTEFRVGLGAADGISAFLQHAVLYLIRAL